jgi:adenosylcobinamide-GDP ribazoletransferase
MMTACLPLVGAVIGVIWWLAAALAGIIAPAPLAAAVIAAMPFLLTGFMHLDGFMDTSDAVLSWRPLEDRLRILKDSHTGAFAVVNLCVLMLFMYGASASVTGRDLRILVLIPVISRCGSAFCVTTLRPLGHSEYKGHGGNAAQRLAIIAVWFIAMITGFVWLGKSAFVLLAETIAYALAMWYVVRILKGVSGDLAGYSLSISELCALIALALIP